MLKAWVAKATLRRGTWLSKFYEPTQGRFSL